MPLLLLPRTLACLSGLDPLAFTGSLLRPECASLPVQVPWYSAMGFDVAIDGHSTAGEPDVLHPAILEALKLEYTPSAPFRTLPHPSLFLC